MSQQPTETISVKLIDEATGDTVAVSQMPASQLPETFAIDTSLAVAGQRYTVVRAEPATRVEFVREGRLTLFLRKVETVDPKDVLFSLPTICGAALPETAQDRSSGSVLVLHEDDWRQCELVSLDHAESITAELAGIQDVYANASVDAGWSRLHVREHIPRPLPAGLRWKDVTARLKKHDPLGAIAFGDARRLVRDAIALSMRNGVVVWGVEPAGELQVLCLQNAGLAAPSTVSALRRLADELSLCLVDWCSCRVYAPGGARIKGALGDPWDEVH
jgi:hypothetical protein